MAEGTAVLLDLEDRPDRAGPWLAELWRHRQVLAMLARKDFHVRYKRASFGVLWAVAVPLIQAVVLIVVFSHIVRLASGLDYPAFVLSGVLAFSYFSQTLGAGATAIVDGSGLTDKVWFPRLLLPMVPALANLVGLAVSMVALVAALPIMGVAVGPHLLLLIPACALLIAFSMALCLVLAALHVYFRDVRFLVQALLLVWFYATPVAYPLSAVGGLAPVLDANPMTGVITLFHLATVGAGGSWLPGLVVSVAVTILLLLGGLEAQRRHDRLFVDLL